MKDYDNEQPTETGERQPTELRGLRPITIGSFCSGYGGLEIGVSRAFGGNTRTVFMVERETFAVANMAHKIQEKRMDSALIYNDVRTFPYRKYRGCIDVAVAGIPCQPHSSAGKRKGGGDERFLFDDWLDGISEMRPSYVLIENVEGLCSSKMPDGTLCLGYVFRRLEDVGYQVERADKTLSFGTFSAAEVGAPHLRKRVFILAKYVADGESIERQRTLTIGDRCERPEETVGSTCTLYPSRPGERQYEWEEPRVVADAESGSARRDVRDVAETDGVKGRPEEQHQDEAGQPVGGGNERQLADAKSGKPRKPKGGNGRKDTGGGSEKLGDASSIGSHRGSEDCTDVEPEVSGTGHESYVAEADSSEAQSELGGTTDGFTRGVDAITNRVDRLRLLGNGVVPDCAELAFRTLFNQLHNNER